MSTADRYSTTARTFTPIDLGNGKVITPILAEGGKMEYQATYYGELIGFEGSEGAAREALNTHVYDLQSSGMMYTAREMDAPIEESITVEQATPIDDPLLEAARWLDNQAFEHGYRQGTAAGAFTGICRTVRADRADRLMAWVEELYTQDAAYLNRFIDRLMLLVPAVPLSEQDDSGAGGLLAAAAYTLYKQGKRDGEQAMLRAITDAVIEGPPAPPAAPAVQVKHWQSDDSRSYADFTAGDGLTKVLIGTYDGDKLGVELIIGGNPINSGIDEVLTLSDVRQLRDNLNAVLDDPRLVAVQVRYEAGAPLKQAA